MKVKISNKGRVQLHYTQQVETISLEIDRRLVLGLLEVLRPLVVDCEELDIEYPHNPTKNTRKILEAWGVQE